jgi:hypothetical protein
MPGLPALSWLESEGTGGAERGVPADELSRLEALGMTHSIFDGSVWELTPLTRGAAGGMHAPRRG